MIDMHPKLRQVLSLIKEQIDITPGDKLGWSVSRKPISQPVVISSQAARELGLILMVQSSLYACDITFYELENILGKLQELEFIDYYDFFDAGMLGEGNYFKIVPKRDFKKRYAELDNHESLPTKPADVERLEDADVSKALLGLDQDLELRYRQVFQDLSVAKRLSYAGPANELREIVRIVLHTLAPTEEVKKRPWFNAARKSEKEGSERLPKDPTQRERAKFALEKRRASDGAIEHATENERLADELLAGIARSSSLRMNASVHGSKDRGEIIRALRYINAFLLDILPGTQ